MGETYKAWNGQDYPSPPPEGWYKASDQTWWPEGSGPGPEKSLTADAPTQIPSAQKPGPANSPETTPAVDPTSKLPTVPNQPATPRPTPPPTGSPNQASAHSQPTTPQAPSSNPASPAPGVTPPGAYPAGQPSQGAQRFGQQPANRPAQQFGPQANPLGQQAGQNWPQSQQKKNGGSMGLIIGIAALGAFGLFAIVILAVILYSPDEATQSELAVSTTDPATTVATTAPPTTAEPTTTTVDSDVAVQELRDHLSLIGIDSSDVDDSAIEATAILSCGRARIIDSAAEWAEVRATEVDTAIESQREAGVDPLSEQQWSQFIDARLVFFCPEEAERLGVTL